MPGFLRKELGFFHTISAPIARPVWRQAACIIANSKSLQSLATVTAHRLHRTVEMVPNGVDIEFFKPATDLRNDQFTFLFSGRFVPQKNLLFLLRQFESLAESNPVKLLLVGDGPEKKAIEKKINSSKQARCSLRSIRGTMKSP